MFVVSPAQCGQPENTYLHFNVDIQVSKNHPQTNLTSEIGKLRANYILYQVKKFVLLGGYSVLPYNSIKPDFSFL